MRRGSLLVALPAASPWPCLPAAPASVQGPLYALRSRRRRYIGELPGDALPPQTVGSAILAICQACVMTHLFDPVAQQQPAADSGSGAWSEAQGAVAQAVQRVLGALSNSFPVAQVGGACPSSSAALVPGRLGVLAVLA